MTQADQKLQLLGLAFAGSDYVFEFARDGRLGLSLGALTQLTGRDPRDMTGAGWRDLFLAEDAPLLETASAALPPGVRRGPLRVRLATASGEGRVVTLSMLRLPQRPEWTSCALNLAPSSALDGLDRRSDGLMDGAAFVEASDRILLEATAGGAPVTLDLLELPGMSARVSHLGEAEAAAARRKVAAALRARAFEGLAVSEVAPDRYAVIRTGDAAVDELDAELKAAVDFHLAPQHHTMKIDQDDAPGQLLLVKHVLNRVVNLDDVAERGLSEFFTAAHGEAAQFRRRLDAGDFVLHYQPIVSLATAELHHFEALARFAEGASPGSVIQLAEDLDIITEFDTAVARMAVSLLRTSGASIAVNVSARSIVRPAFRAELLALAPAEGAALRRRLLIELTETHELTDFDAAVEGLRELRAAGHPICLDDFGAGASSLDYIRRLPLDYIKIDGRYIREVTSKGRDFTLLKHVTALCHDLGVPVIAEAVETTETALLLSEAKVDLAQGWLFGRPTSRPTWSPSATSLTLARARAAANVGPRTAS